MLTFSAAVVELPDNPEEETKIEQGPAKRHKSATVELELIVSEQVDAEASDGDALDAEVPQVQPAAQPGASVAVEDQVKAEPREADTRASGTQTLAEPAEATPRSAERSREQCHRIINDVRRAFDRIRPLVARLGPAEDCSPLRVTATRLRYDVLKARVDTSQLRLASIAARLAALRAP